jgi:hypothetical protein
MVPGFFPPMPGPGDPGMGMPGPNGPPMGMNSVKAAMEQASFEEQEKPPEKPAAKRPVGLLQVLFGGGKSK